MKYSIRVLLVMLLIASLAGAADQRVTMEKKEVEVKRHRFDPDRPPTDLPKLNPGESAVTTSWFEIRAEFTGEVTDQSRQPSGAVSAKLRVESIKVRISLSIDIWLPFDASQELRDHEEGHRKLNEAYYKDAEDTARKVAESYIGKTVTGAGRSLDAATQAGVEKAIKELTEGYLKATHVPAGRANEIYDKLTNHGRNQRISLDDAIQQAIEKTAAEKKP
jgi:hypothetical protein